jgi:ribosome-associated toxin RatA of RatAB toxin-antitoxin module
MRLLFLACWLVVLGAGPAFAAGEVAVDAIRKGEFIEVRAHAVIDAPLSIVWSTLTDYERLPEFIPGLKKSKLVSRRGSSVVVEQSGEARFLMFSFPIDVTLEAVESPRSSIKVRALSGNLRHFEGGYYLEPEHGGQRIGLRWVGTIIPEVSLPPLIGEVVMRLRIEDQFVGMVREIERRESVRRGLEQEPSSK